MRYVVETLNAGYEVIEQRFFEDEDEAYNYWMITDSVKKMRVLRD